MIRITFDPTLGNWSYVGALTSSVSPSAATMNLGWVLDSTTDQPFEKGVILHEFGHALGLTHEHSLSTRLDPTGESTH